jgi:hypothetical protein
MAAELVAAKGPGAVVLITVLAARLPVCSAASAMNGL